jgi:hypothetical protein
VDVRVGPRGASAGRIERQQQGFAVRPAAVMPRVAVDPAGAGAGSTGGGVLANGLLGEVGVVAAVEAVQEVL